MGEDFNDPDLLDKLYNEKGMSERKIADKLDCHHSTIHRRLEKFDIEKRDKSEAVMNFYDDGGKYRNKKWLENKYKKEKMSIPEIADECDVSIAAVDKQLEKYNIEKRSISEGVSNYYIRNKFVPISNVNGYEYWNHCYKSNKNSIAVHRLLAVAEYGYDEVVDKDVHHKNHIKWDNRPDNIELMDKSKHGKMHSDEYYED